MQRYMYYLLALIVLLYPALNQAEDYTLQYEELLNTAEAQQIIRYGDIDNLGFDWPAGFNVFTGESTPGHYFPWAIDPADADGTDRMMVISSYANSPPAGQDGYTSSTARPDNNPREIVMTFTPPNSAIHTALLQIFVDDFQAPVWHAQYQVTMNDVRVPELEAILNSLVQTGPIGKLITFQLPPYIVDTLTNNALRILIDDPTTGAGDGFAFDFFRLLINPRELQHTGTINGTVIDATTTAPIAGVNITTGTAQVTTDSAGYYELREVPAGLVTVQAALLGYQGMTANVDLIFDAAVTQDFQLQPLPVYSLWVNTTGNGTVDVQSDLPAMPSCLSLNCPRSYVSGTTVTLTAQPAAGTTFIGWNGTCTGTELTCVIMMTGEQTITAMFQLPMQLLTTVVVGAGSITSTPAGINCGRDCSEAYRNDQTITLTAKTKTGAAFLGWGGGCTGSTMTCTVSMNKTQFVVAIFNTPQHALTVINAGPGHVTSTPTRINCGAECLAMYAADKTVKLIAKANSGAQFIGWGGACSGNSRTCTVNMTAAQTVAAVFRAPTASLMVTTTGHGRVTSTPAGINCGNDCSDNYAMNTVVTLTAKPATGGQFTHWAGACTGKKMSCVVTLNKSKTVQAHFTP